jgi:hypothetical protein
MRQELLPYGINLSGLKHLPAATVAQREEAFTRLKKNGLGAALIENSEMLERAARQFDRLAQQAEPGMRLIQAEDNGYDDCAFAWDVLTIEMEIATFFMCFMGFAPLCFLLGADVLLLKVLKMIMCGDWSWSDVTSLLGG